MRTTIPMLLAAAIASTIASPSLAQAPAASTGTASASASAVGNLQSEIAALNLMTDAIGPATKDSEARIAQMQAFMAAKNLTTAYRS
ncbi:MAG: hypothetical protein ACO38P_07975, partial [Phycisphaerales bacterium]